jgi:hypothetical protein
MDIQIVPIDEIFFNPCTNEQMQTVGSIKILSKVHFTAGDRIHLVLKQQMYTLGAVGLDSGIYYKAVGRNLTRQINGVLGENGVLKEVSQFGYISKGSAPNWFASFLFQIVVTPNGDVVVDKFVPFEVECR